VKDTLETMTKLVGLFSVGALGLSVFHELGFFTVTGNDFRHLFSISDYFASVVAWMPESVFFLFVAAFLIFILQLTRWNFLYNYPKHKLPYTLSDRLTDWTLYLTFFHGTSGSLVRPALVTLIKRDASGC
jgi:hypothetical protein